MPFLPHQTGSWGLGREKLETGIPQRDQQRASTATWGGIIRVPQLHRGLPLPPELQSVLTTAPYGSLHLAVALFLRLGLRRWQGRD